MDPQNLGAIIRSAYFFGASGVVLCAKNSAPLSGVLTKASVGSLELTELRSCNNMMQFLVSLAKSGTINCLFSEIQLCFNISLMTNSE
ncbi:putative tRNA/rRNA methyltransferase, SpoU type, tRNA (guanine-N1-)-methyltransferase [Helianthus anomalus]